MKTSALNIAAVAALALACSKGEAAPTNITPAEMAVLPPYCRDAQTFNGYGGTPDSWSPNAPKWIALMGKGFLAVHHYCWALINLSRVQKPGTPDVIRHGTYQEAYGDLYYVIEHSDASMVLLPEIYTKMGEVQLELKRPRDAHASFDKARSLKRDYWPPYFHWAEYLKRAGQRAEARRVVEDGLSYSPNAKPLQELLKTLGGDPKTVKPRAAGVDGEGKAGPKEGAAGAEKPPAISAD